MVRSQKSMTNKTEFRASNPAILDYNQQRDLLLQNLKRLPPTELHYYFALLLASIENEPNPEQLTHLIVKTIDVVKKLRQFYADVDNQSKPDLTEVTTALNALILASKMHTTSHTVKKAALGVCSVVLGFIFGVIGAATGLIAGLFSDYSIIGNLRASGLWFVTGLFLGAFIGSRCPSLVFQSSFERKLEFCINSIEKVGKELPSKKTHAEYEAETKQYILDVFFKNIPESKKEAAFNAFLKSDNQKFQVSTTTAGFISKSLKGHLGHHYLIAYSINGKQDIPMEYGSRIKTPRFFDQNESPRVITGKKLFDMLVLDRMLQETYKYTLKGFFKDYEIGSNDCRTYVEKILIGTGQAPTQINRFNPKIDKWSATNIIGPIVRFFSKTKEMELMPFVKHYKNDPNDPDPVITARKWSEKKEEIPKEQRNVSFSPGIVQI
ncbi:hypothetical protein EP47_13545 [Legionella norrlandica]|uniref:Uncharacterized protein n=1 Tax=Legionella norrlandica TaxID=1498499 RepID=A0A0A2SNJ9_9GAMM|nr:hypothetical protein [Legionella norrlandica]KGP62725.1 hypothetical protein EP47_13545 [Legionella norrlandica]